MQFVLKPFIPLLSSHIFGNLMLQKDYQNPCDPVFVWSHWEWS